MHLRLHHRFLPLTAFAAKEHYIGVATNARNREIRRAIHTESRLLNQNMLIPLLLLLYRGLHHQDIELATLPLHDLRLLRQMHGRWCVTPCCADLVASASDGHPVIAKHRLLVLLDTR